MSDIWPPDLSDGVAYRVRIHDRDHPEGINQAVFEGHTTLSISPFPSHRRTGPRAELSFDALPGVTFLAAAKGHSAYRPGAASIGDERWCVLLLDRYDPQYPYGPDGPSIGEALEMALAVFEVSEAVEVDFADDPR